MRQRDRKKVIDRQSLFNIHLARFMAELNQTVEEAYRFFDEFIAPVEAGEQDKHRPGLPIKSASSEAIGKGPQTG